MDILGDPQRQRHKRSYAEMSQPSTLSPSPIQFRGSPATFGHRFASAAPSNPPSLENRRTPHPHNQNSQHPRRSPEDMADVQVQRPRLEHRTSQTIIDLTDDPDELLAFPARHQRDRGRSQRPPQLGRSDASGVMGLIDLTEDQADPDIIITGERELSAPRESRPRHGRGAFQQQSVRRDSPGLFVPPAPPAPAQPRIHQMIGGVANAAFQFLGGRREPARAPANQVHRHDPHHAFHIRFAEEVVGFDMAGVLNQVMPGRMDYAHPAFAQRKPEHVPPKAARENFTRSPKEDMEIVCPSCEEELVHNKEIEAPVLKKNGKAPSKKEREEHPFWVVKECGHIYCNRCFQNRGPPGKVDKVFFDEVGKSSSKSKGAAKQLFCSVENCESDVKNKDKWVGVFL